MEAQRLITVSLGKIASSRCQRGGINLHRNLLVASVLHKARTAYMMDAYQHIIASRKQKQEVSDSSEKDAGCKGESGVPDVCGAGRPGSVVAMTHAATGISHAVQEDKENSPPTTTTQSTNSQDKDFSSSVMLGVENTSARLENTVSEDVECKSTTSIPSASSKNANCASCGDSALKMSVQNRLCTAVTCSAGKRRRSRNSDSSECSSESVVSPKKARLDIQQKNEVLCEKENLENLASEILSDTTTLTHEDVSTVHDSGVTCKVTKSCDRPEPMQTESTQITSLVTIFNSGFSGLCSRNTPSDTNSSAQSQPLSCATELKQESVQIPSVIALTV